MSGRRQKRETDPNAQPVLQFRYCATKCCAPHCKECGYFLGRRPRVPRDARQACVVAQGSWLRGDLDVTDTELLRRIDAAVWAGDERTLYELAPCHCCCHEHTFEDCVARALGRRPRLGCGGGHPRPPPRGRVVGLGYYGQAHGMTRAEFFGGEATSSSFS